MEDRRVFLKSLAATLAASRSVFGANDRVQMGVIGTGTRGNQVYQSFMRNKDVTFVTACDVQKSRVDKFVADSKAKMTAVGDYRRVLDNKDVDAVLLTTPDHWHSPMVIEALQAGKDIYCEKPVSNTLEAALKMRDACRTSKRIVQVGCQQRSWQHFQDQAKRVKGGTSAPSISACSCFRASAVSARPRRRSRKPRRPTSIGRCSRVRPRVTRSCPAG